MAALLFYRRPVILNREEHARLRVKAAVGGFSFANAVNSVPLAGIEFSDACRSLPIVFSDNPDGKGFPLALVGLRQDENLLVDADGKWLGDYIPAFVRRYPFVLQEKPDASDFSVLIDEAYEGFGTEAGESLFSEDGKDTPVLAGAIEFLSNFQAVAERTREFVARLHEFKLLVPRAIQVSLPDAAPFVMQGFAAVDEEKLAALSGKQLSALAKNGELGWIYAHLVSLGTVPQLLRHLQDKIAQTSAGSLKDNA